jgi:hypothetical protein
MELSSDAVGIRLFGPALFFAEVHLMTAFKHIDQGSVSHPPNRLRETLNKYLLVGADRAASESALRTNLLSLATTRTRHVGNDPCCIWQPKQPITGAGEGTRPVEQTPA